MRTGLESIFHLQVTTRWIPIRTYKRFNLWVHASVNPRSLTIPVQYLIRQSVRIESICTSTISPKIFL